MPSTLQTGTPNPTRARAYLAWAFVCLVWGTTYLAIRIALETIPPLLMGGIRFLVAGLLMIIMLAARGETLPGVRALPALTILGVLMLGLIAAQIACLGWALGSIFGRRRGHTDARDENVLVTAAYEMLFGGLFLFLAGTARGELGWLAFNTRTAAALAYLIVFGAIGGFTAFAYALKHLPVATASLYAYVNPVIAVILGTLILKEPFNARMGIAAAVVLAGMALVRET